MAEQHLNIIAFNIPYPPDYGGVIDVYYKIKALHAAGIKIHLHCFAYGRNVSPELEKYCESIHVYKRKNMFQGFLSDKPFIVSSRSSKLLKKNLLQNSYPILFEGLHCCYYLDDKAFAGRKKIVRMHNDEAEYYLQLAKHEKRFSKKLYFYEEYKRLFKYENILSKADHIVCIAKYEAEKYENKFAHVSHLAPFHGADVVHSLTGSGDFALYHGNLTVNENIQAVLFLISEVFSQLSHTLIIAGNNPAKEIVSEAAKYQNIRVQQNPSPSELLLLSQQAQIHILPAFQQTGIKLKLLYALFNGRFCLANSMMTKDTGLEKYCSIADSVEEMKIAIEELFSKEFTAGDIVFRKNIEKEFSDTAEAEKLISLL